MPGPARETHEWVSFIDDEGRRVVFDLTFLSSNWACIYGRGCPGVLTEAAPEHEQGCCSYGAHVTGRVDQDRVLDASTRLRPDQWEHRDEALDGGPFTTDEDGDTVTKQVDGTCIFLNAPDFPSGAGCALHRGALDAGERPMDWKPDVCWQLPLRLEEHEDDNGTVTLFLRQWERADWGEGGQEFHWWCTEDAQAFVGDRPAYVELRDEIIALVGSGPYTRLVDHLDHQRRTEVLLPHPARRR